MHDPASVTLPRQAAVFAGLLVAGLAVYWPVFDMTPLGGDNLYALAWLHFAPFTSLAALDPAIYPEWRPLAYASVWLMHHVLPLDAGWVHYLFNITVWVGCAWMVFRLVVELSGAAWAGVLAALVLLADRRSHEAMYWIIERQMSMACLFGLIALWMIARRRGQPLIRRESWWLLLVLLAAGLSKEYGLAFGAAVLAYGAWHRRPDLTWAAGASLAVYATLRLVLAGGGVGPYCEEMAFFGEHVRRCFDVTSAGSWGQSLYNVMAAAAATPLRGLFDEFGAPAITPDRLAIACLITLVAVIGLIRGPRSVALLALVMVFAAILNFPIFRERNLLVGAAAMAVLVGIGLARWSELVVSSRRRRALHVIVVLLLSALLVRQFVHSHRILSGVVTHGFHHDPCYSPHRERVFWVTFMPVLQEAYGLDSPDCSGTQ